MRRNAPHCVVALFAFSVGLITADSYHTLACALPLSLLTLLFTRSLPRVELDPHFIIVVVMSLLLWAAGLAACLSVLSWEGGSCVVEFSGGDEVIGEKSNGVQPPSTNMVPAEIPDNPCGGTGVSPSGVGSVWAGVVDKKATAKPAPHYPPIARAARAEGVVAVWVLIEESGRVERSQAISGHPLLRQSATQAACSARFSPVTADGPPVRVSGILTYKFML